MILKRYCFAPALCFLLALLTLGWVSPALADDDSVASGMSARERFYKKYKERIPKTNPDAGYDDRVAPSGSTVDRDERLREIQKRREEMRKARKARRAERRKKIGDAGDRMDGKAADISKKEKERLDARRKAMQERKAARKEEYTKKIEKRRQAIREKARKHRETMKDNVDTGTQGYDDTGTRQPADDKAGNASSAREARREQLNKRREAMREKSRKIREKMKGDINVETGAPGYDDAGVGQKGDDAVGKRSPGKMDRMEELRKRREAMREKARKARDDLRSKRQSHRGNPDVGMDSSASSSPHVSGATSPGLDDTGGANPHISGSTSPDARPHISGAR